MSYPPSIFHALRRARRLLGCVVAWWTLSLVAAVITPALAASSDDAPLHQLCSALGAQQPAEPNTILPGEPAHLGWHCVLCLGGAAPAAATPAQATVSNSGTTFVRAAAIPAPYSRHAGPAAARGPPAA